MPSRSPGGHAGVAHDAGDQGLQPALERDVSRGGRAAPRRSPARTTAAEKSPRRRPNRARSFRLTHDDGARSVAGALDLDLVTPRGDRVPRVDPTTRRRRSNRRESASSRPSSKTLARILDAEQVEVIHARARPPGDRRVPVTEGETSGSSLSSDPQEHGPRLRTNAVFPAPSGPASATTSPGRRARAKYAANASNSACGEGMAFIFRLRPAFAGPKTAPGKIKKVPQRVPSPTTVGLQAGRLYL